MKYMILLVFIFLLGCASNQRAGGLYEPKFYSKMLAENNQQPVIKSNTVIKTYHSALGNLCKSYQVSNGHSLVCTDGITEKQVRILQ